MPQWGTDQKSLNLGWISDACFGSAGGIVLFLLVPSELVLETPAQILRALALALVGGYGGPAVLDRALSMSMRELSEKTQELAERTQSVETKLADDDRERLTDTSAMSLVDRHLDEKAPPVGEKEMLEVLAGASSSVRHYIFQQVREIRRSTWRKDKSKMERTIPVFRALAESDKKKQNHRYYGQLGYALKDQLCPDFSAAKVALERAIRIRNAGEDRDWFPLYEFNRALCTIELDNQENQALRSDPETVEAVMADLEIAKAHLDLSSIVNEDPVKGWLERNGIDPADIL